MPLIGDKRSGSAHLQVAVVVDSNLMPAWMARIVKYLKTAEFIDLATVILNDRTNKEDAARAPWFFKLYEKLDMLFFRPTANPLGRVNVSDLLTGIEQRRISELTFFGTSLAEEPRWEVVIWLSQKEVPAELAGYSRRGTWWFRHSTSAHPRKSAEYFWEIYNQNPISRVDLLVATRAGAEPEVASSAVSSSELGWSLSKNRQVPYSRAPALLMAQLHRLGNQQAATFEGTGANGAEGGRYPTAAQMARFLIRNAKRTVNRRIKYSHQERHWFVAYRSQKSKFVSQTRRFEPGGFTELRAAPGHFYADPFVVDWSGRSFVFFEDYPYKEKKGIISAAEVNTDGSLGLVERALERPYHLSYPFTFEYEREVFMIPETLANRSIELYRAVELPVRWELICVLKKDIDAVDTTLWIEDGVFFFFTSIAEGGATVNDDLFLFHSRELCGEWTPHPANPICTDVRRSRSAGKLFRREGKLIRPGQDCSVRYGYACQLNEIEELSPKRYRERPVDRIEPTWHPNLIGTHTINTGASVEVIDGQIYRPKAKVRN